MGTGSISTLKGGFFTDTASGFTSFLYNATADNGGFKVYVLGDGNGTDNTINGQGYYNWRNPAMFGWDQSLFLSTTPQTANFSGGTVNGQIMMLTVAVPEPTTAALALAGAAAGAWTLLRRRS